MTSPPAGKNTQSDKNITTLSSSTTSSPPSSFNEEACSPPRPSPDDDLEAPSLGTKPSLALDSSTRRRRRRLDSIDVLRGWAIIFMVMIHFVDNWSPCGSEPDNTLCNVLDHVSSGSAPTFTFLVGMSLQLSLDKQREGNMATTSSSSESTIAIRTTKRGLAVFFIGFVFSFSIYGPYDVFEWDILTLIGASICLLYWLQRLLPSSVALTLLSLAILLVSPLWRDNSYYDEYWQDDSYEYDYTAWDIFMGFFVNGYFPLFPWLLYPLAGMIVGRHLPKQRNDYDNNNSNSSKVWFGVLLGVGLCLIALALAITQTESNLGYYDTYFSFYPATTPFQLLSLGSLLCMFGVLHRWLDSVDHCPPQQQATSTEICDNASCPSATAPTNDLPSTSTSPPRRRHPCLHFILRFLTRYSHFSLTVYVLHHAVLQWPLYLASLVNGHYAYYYFENATNASQAFGLSLLFLAVCYGGLVWWEDHAKGVYSMEWFLAKMTS